jgi:hypothetical protein
MTVSAMPSSDVHIRTLPLAARVPSGQRSPDEIVAAKLKAI